MKTQNPVIVRYITGIAILFFVGFTGCNILWTSVEIAIAFSIVDLIQRGGPNPPRKS